MKGCAPLIVLLTASCQEAYYATERMDLVIVNKFSQPVRIEYAEAMCHIDAQTELIVMPGMQETAVIKLVGKNTKHRITIHNSEGRTASIAFTDKDYYLAKRVGAQPFDRIVIDQLFDVHSE